MAKLECCFCLPVPYKVLYIVTTLLLAGEITFIVFEGINVKQISDEYDLILDTPSEKLDNSIVSNFFDINSIANKYVDIANKTDFVPICCSYTQNDEYLLGYTLPIVSVSVSGFGIIIGIFACYYGLPRTLKIHKDKNYNYDNSFPFYNSVPRKKKTDKKIVRYKRVLTVVKVIEIFILLLTLASIGWMLKIYFNNDINDYGELHQFNNITEYRTCNYTCSYYVNIDYEHVCEANFQCYDENIVDEIEEKYCAKDTNKVVIDWNSPFKIFECVPYHGIGKNNYEFNIRGEFIYVFNYENYKNFIFNVRDLFRISLALSSGEEIIQFLSFALLAIPLFV